MEKYLHNILIISSHYYPVMGGTATHCENLCLELTKLGYQVTLITHGEWYNSDVEFHDKNQSYRIIRLQSPCPSKEIMFFPISVGKYINRVIDEIHPDIINITMGNFVPLGLKISKNHHIPIIFTVHNVPPEEYNFSYFKNASLNNSLKKIYYQLIRKLEHLCLVCGRYDAIISGSERTRGRLIAAGADPNDIKVISYGTHLPVLKEKPVSSSLNIVLIAGIIGHKGQLDAVHAMPLVCGKVPNAKLHLIGPIRDGIYYQEILYEIKKLELQDVVLVHGEVSSEELENMYRICDIYIQPSYQEGFCLTVLDALAYGLPVIGTPVGAIPEMIGDNRGILIPSPNPENIAEAVIMLALNHSLAESCGIAARKFVDEKFTWKAITEDTVAYFQEIWENRYNNENEINE